MKRQNSQDSKGETSKTVPKKILTNHPTNNNPYKLTTQDSVYKMGANIDSIPGANRLEQIGNLSQVLEISSESEYTSQIFIKDMGWLVFNFNSEENLQICLKHTKHNIHGITFSRITDTEIKGKEIYTPPFKRIHKSADQKPKYFANYPNQEHLKNAQIHNNPSKDLQLQIIDIPLDFSPNRVKGALKRYGRINNVKLSINRLKKNKTAIVHLCPYPNSKNLDNVWSIPMGNIMARIAINNEDPSIFAQRNKYTARLYGINNDTSPTRIMSAIKHTGAKSCYIPTNSATLKRRKYAVVSYQSRTELKCATRSSIYLDNKKLKWTIDNTIDSPCSQESSSTENTKPTDIMSMGHMTEIEDQWELSKRKHCRPTSMEWSQEESDHESFLQNLPSNRFTEDCLIRNSVTEDETPNTVVNIKRKKQDIKHKKSNKPHGHHKRSSQDDPSLSASLATLIGQINNLSSRLERMEANQTQANRKQKGVAPNRS
jgi:hypothetical protein